MQYRNLKLAPRMLRAEAAEEYVGGPQMLRDMHAAGWVRPAKRGNRLTVWDVKVLDSACDRLSSGDELPPAPRNWTSC